MTLALIALSVLGVDGDDAPSRFRLGIDLTGGAAITGPATSATIGAGLELAALPARALRIRLDGRAGWSAGRIGGFTATGGLDLVVPTWWGEVFGGLGGGIVSSNQFSQTLNVIAPLAGARVGVDLLLTRPAYLGALLSYDIAFASGFSPLHLIGFGLRVGFAL